MKHLSRDNNLRPLFEMSRFFVTNFSKQESEMMLKIRGKFLFFFLWRVEIGGMQEGRRASHEPWLCVPWLGAESGMNGKSGTMHPTEDLYMYRLSHRTVGTKAKFMLFFVFFSLCGKHTPPSFRFTWASFVQEYMKLNQWTVSLASMAKATKQQYFIDVEPSLLCDARLFVYNISQFAQWSIRKIFHPGTKTMRTQTGFLWLWPTRTFLICSQESPKRGREILFWWASRKEKQNTTEVSSLCQYPGDVVLCVTFRFALKPILALTRENCGSYRLWSQEIWLLKRDTRNFSWSVRHSRAEHPVWNYQENFVGLSLVHQTVWSP